MHAPHRRCSVGAGLGPVPQRLQVVWQVGGIVLGRLSVPPVAPSLRVRRKASYSQRASRWWFKEVNPICGACRASSASRCCRVDTMSGFDAPCMVPSNGSLTRCPPSLRRLLQGAVRRFRGYYGDTPTPAALPALLEDVGRYHSCACRFAPTRLRRTAGRPGGFGCGSPRADARFRGGRQVSPVPGEP